MSQTSILQPFLDARLPDGIGMRIEEIFAGWYAPNEPHQLLRQPGVRMERPRHSVNCEARLALTIRDLNVFIEGDGPEASLDGEVLFEQFSGARNASFLLDSASSGVHYRRMDVGAGSAELAYRLRFRDRDRSFTIAGLRVLGQTALNPLGLHSIAQSYAVLYAEVSQVWEPDPVPAGAAELILAGFDEIANRHDLAALLATHEVIGTEDPRLRLLAQMRFLAFTGQFLRLRDPNAAEIIPIRPPNPPEPRRDRVAIPITPPTAREPAYESRKKPTTPEPSPPVTVWDVFLCHNSSDRTFVTEIEQRLRDEHLAAWLDASALPPGTHWVTELDQAFREGRIRSSVAFVGPAGIGAAQDFEINMLTEQWTRNRHPTIPVLLPGFDGDPYLLPPLLRMSKWIDFRLKVDIRVLLDRIKAIKAAARSAG